MTSCLGYLGITINDRMELEELFRYDVLVTCPPHFNVTFSLPNWSSRPDRTFDVILDDAHTSYRVFVTTITFPGDNDDTDNDDVIKPGSAVGGWSIAALLSIAIIVSVLVLGTCGYVFLETSSHRRRHRSTDQHDLAVTASRLQSPADYDARRRRTIVVIHVLLRIVFALSCTFTACSSVFYVSQSQRLNDISQLPAIKDRFDAAAAAARHQLSEHVERSPVADVARVREMQLACDGYFSELATAVVDRVAVAARVADEAGNSAVRMYSRMTRRISDEMERLVADLRQWLGVQLRPAVSVVHRVIVQSLNSPWLSCAHNLCNKSVECSTHTSKSPSHSTDDVIFLLPPETSTFARFLNICCADEIGLLHRRLSDR